MKKRLLAWCAFLTILAAAAPARASVITVGDGDSWYEFLFGGTNSFAGACGGGCIASSGNNAVDAGAPPWTFTGPAYLTVTDAFNSGDQFKVFDNLVELGTTPLVGQNSDCGSDPAWCSIDPFNSHGTWLLGGGNHSITIQAITSPYGHGAGYFQAVDPVPEPASMFLLGTGALGLVARLRRRRRAQP